jgi:hypothetical protein
VDTASSILQFITDGLNFGVLGLVFYLFVGGKLHSDDEMRSLRSDLELEKRAHEVTRAALALASARAETSVMTSELVLQALRGPVQREASA